jgi:oligosaccharide repeat unit polymerase
VFPAIVLVYALVPLVGFILSGFTFEANLDARLPLLAHGSEEVLQVAGLHLLFLFGFCLVYSLFRPRQRGFAPGDVVCTDGRLPAILAVAAVASALAPLVMKRVLGVESAEDYIGTYLEMAGQPLWIQQVYGVMNATGTAMLIAAIVAAFAFRRRLLFLATAVVVGLTLFAIASGGSRTLAMATLLSLIVSYALVVRPISIGRAALLGGLMISVFVFAQFLRDFAAEEEVTSFAALLVNNEFSIVFVNALDIDQRSQSLARAGILPNFYFVDLGRFFPQQILPFEKVDPNKWYVTTIYPEYAEQGGGLAFGAITEAAAGFGPAEALIRGLLLGLLFAFVQAVVSRPRFRTLMSLIAYVWLVVFCYQSFRDTTFSLAGRFVYNALPALLLVRLLQVALAPRAPSRTPIAQGASAVLDGR